MNDDHNATADTKSSDTRSRMSLRTHAADRIKHLPDCDCPRPILQPWMIVTVAEANAIAACVKATTADLHPLTRRERAALDALQALSRRAYGTGLFSSGPLHAVFGQPPPPSLHELWEQTALHCYLCLCPVDNPNPPAAHIDHITPRGRGGTDQTTNLAIVHAECNLAKGPRDWWNLPPGFHPHRTEIERFASRLLAQMKRPTTPGAVYDLIKEMCFSAGETKEDSGGWSPAALSDSLVHARRLAHRRSPDPDLIRGTDHSRHPTNY